MYQSWLKALRRRWGTTEYEEGGVEDRDMDGAGKALLSDKQHDVDGHNKFFFDDGNKRMPSTCCGRTNSIPTPPQRTRLSSILRCGLGISLLSVATIMAWIMAKPFPTNLRESIMTTDGKSFPSGQLTWSHHFEPLPCGTSPEEALALGCHFDIIATAWLPPRCIDKDLVAEFEATYPWRYFRNPDGTDPYPDDGHDALGSQNTTIWTTKRWHVAHCLYMWRKLNRALVRGRMTDGETITQWHTDHCTNLILQMGDPDAIATIVEIIYPPC